VGDETSWRAIFAVAGAVYARSLFDTFRTAFSLCLGWIPISEDEIDDDIRKMVEFWRKMATEGGGMTVKFQR